MGETAKPAKRINSRPSPGEVRRRKGKGDGRQSEDHFKEWCYLLLVPSIVVALLLFGLSHLVSPRLVVAVAAIPTVILAFAILVIVDPEMITCRSGGTALLGPGHLLWGYFLWMVIMAAGSIFNFALFITYAEQQKLLFASEKVTCCLGLVIGGYRTIVAWRTKRLRCRTVKTGGSRTKGQGT